MRTIVVSDLHLGARQGRARLHDPDVLATLTSALAGADRLVLLGDVVELRQGPLPEAFAAALPILSAIGDALGPGREVVLVPGNHDHHLLESWSARLAAAGPPPELGLSAEIDWVPGEPLAALAGALGRGGASVTARYPGVWLRDDVYAMHGHYLDRHTTVPILERLSAGFTARALRQPLGSLARAEDYEATLVPTYAWIHAMAQARAASPPLARPVGEPGEHGSMSIWRALNGDRRASRLRRCWLGAGVRGAVIAVNRLGLGPVRPDLSTAALRHSSLIAFGEVLSALSVPARYALFGHSHRAGPLPADDQSEWTAPAGARILNTGCWVSEPDFVGRKIATSPYRAGFAATVEDGSDPPILHNLLDPAPPG